VDKLAQGSLIVLADRSRHLKDSVDEKEVDTLAYRRDFARKTLEKNGVASKKISDRFLLTSTGRAYCGLGFK
jgi:hypothetical protein